MKADTPSFISLRTETPRVSLLTTPKSILRIFTFEPQQQGDEPGVMPIAQQGGDGTHIVPLSQIFNEKTVVAPVGKL